MSLLGPENQESFTSVRQQANQRTRELEKEIKASSKSKRNWSIFWLVIALGWSLFYFLGSH